MNIAVIGAGSSGLITLKELLDAFPRESVSCFEKSHSLRGCWGDQRPDFISTSTKYSTQFSCYRRFPLEVSGVQDGSEFYRGSEFGDYLEAFAAHFDLPERIHFGVEVQSLRRRAKAWELHIVEQGKTQVLTFDAVFLCTGLVNKPLPLPSERIPIVRQAEAIRDATVVVVGGGESASDIANHLAQPAKNNKVYLSLRSGIRVSPRYHPIRGVPSDFLRNRLLLSFSKGLRNWLGERFVSFRIRFAGFLGKLFPHQRDNLSPNEELQARRRYWDLKLKARAKGRLFNVFHNKSDDFLDAVAEQRLHIIGPPLEDSWTHYHDFEQQSTLKLSPDALVPATGFDARLAELSEGTIQLRDFYQGCVHSDMKQLFLVGFARPIIGNIPTISELQARYCVGVLSGRYHVPADIKARQERVWRLLCKEYSSLDTRSVYPVEQFPYCDTLARAMGIMPRLGRGMSLSLWCKTMLVPASTSHYLDDYFDEQAIRQQSVYTPPLLVAVMVLIGLIAWPYQHLKEDRHVLDG